VKDACRVFNFSAGPATLPLPVLEEAQRSLISIPGVGASALEVSHRSPWFEGVIAEAQDNIMHLLHVPADYGCYSLKVGRPFNSRWSP
jgi:phosphoserine aminotransferase